jgi:hypothetical protein
MYKKSLLLAASLLATTAAHSGCRAAKICGERDVIIERLKPRYGEVQTGAGMTNTNGIVEVFASEETGTWTIIVTLPSGQSCLVAAGNHWAPGSGELTRSGHPV